jgi:hypothetical protein
VPEIFTVSAADELPYYNPLFKLVINRELEFNPPNQELQDNFWLINEIKKHHLPKIYDKMARDKKQRFYLIHKYLRSVGFEEWFDQVRADTRFEYKGMKSFKGLNIYRFDLAQ